MQEASENLKKKITMPPVIAFHAFHCQFVVGTEAFSVALGVVLAQKKQDEKLQTIQFLSRTITEQERQ